MVTIIAWTIIASSLMTAITEGKPACQTACIEIYRPVCGTNGRTYSNDCELEAAICLSGPNAGLKKKRDGQCTREDCPIIGCTEQYEPVCGTDGKTYGNVCQLGVDSCLEQSSVTVAHEGECSQ